MSNSHSYFPRNPKFTDSFERDLANDDASHLGRDEPSLLMPLLKRLGAGLAALIRSVRFLRTAAQRPELGIKAS